MSKIMSLGDLQLLKTQVKRQMTLRENGDHVEQMIKIKVAMATCGIAAGAREIMNYLAQLIAEKDIQNIVLVQGECMGHCDMEPIVEVTLVGCEPVMYGHVTKVRAKDILEKYIQGGEMIEGIIPTSHKSIEE